MLKSFSLSYCGTLLHEVFAFDKDHARRVALRELEMIPAFAYPLAPFEFRARLLWADIDVRPLADPEGTERRMRERCSYIFEC